MTSPPGADEPRVLIIAEHASARFGGEAILPLHYFRRLRAIGVETWLIVHERTRNELADLLGADLARVEFIPDRAIHKIVHRLSRYLPQRISNFTFGYISRLSAQIEARRAARRLIAAKGIGVVHQPIPVSPREPSLLYDLGVPVVIGPLNGGMEYPDAFKSNRRSVRVTSSLVAAARRASSLLHRVFPGKLDAATILVANARTRAALPANTRAAVVDLPENGVDVSLWSPKESRPNDAAAGLTKFVFIGRLVDWKCVDLLIRAFEQVERACPSTLTIVGDGPMRADLERQAAPLIARNAVSFLGWLDHAKSADVLATCDVFVLPSVFESGGAVVLEALACEVPVIALRWGGPADYLDESCGILIEPRGYPDLVDDFARAMIELATSPARRERMGRAGRTKVATTTLNWDEKIPAIMAEYRAAQARYRARTASVTR